MSYITVLIYVAYYNGIVNYQDNNYIFVSAMVNPLARASSN